LIVFLLAIENLHIPKIMMSSVNDQQNIEQIEKVNLKTDDKDEAKA